MNNEKNNSKETRSRKDWEKKIIPWETVVIMDVSYKWKGRRKFWVLVFRCWLIRRNILWKQIPYETIEQYKRGIRELIKQWRKVLAIVCDGRRGILKSFPNIPVQMCQRHQAEIVRRYISRKSRWEANKELLDMADSLPHISKETFKVWLEDIYRRHKDFINEKNMKWWYKHKRTRSSYRSLAYHAPRLFTCQDHVWEIDIPNTTNSLEAEFGHLNEIVAVHRWLRSIRKRKVIDHYLGFH